MLTLQRIAVEQSAETALEYFQRGVAKGDKIAQLLLGVMHEEGIAVEQNPKAAANLYQQAALQGIAEAQYRLGNPPFPL